MIMHGMKETATNTNAFGSSAYNSAIPYLSLDADLEVSYLSLCVVYFLKICILVKKELTKKK